MSFINDLVGDNGGGSGLAGRLGNTVANTAKASASAIVENKLAAESDPVKRAAIVLAGAGAQYLLDKALAKDRQKIPKPYMGDPVELRQQTYIKTPEHTYNTYFRPRYANDHIYNDSHPMYSSLFLVDFVFNQEILEDVGSNPLSGLFKSGFPLSTSFLLKSSTFPKVNMEYTKINQYNKYVYRHKKLTYEPVTMAFTDIYTPVSDDNVKRVSMMNFMKEYLSYYSNDITNSEHSLMHGISSDRKHYNFISKINIYMFWNSGTKMISLINPTIQNFTYSELSYEDDNPVSVSCGIDYEYLEMSNLDITTDEFMELASHLLDDVADGYSPDTDQPINDLDSDALQPMDSSRFKDAQRRIGLDNPVAAMAIRLAEVTAMSKFGNDLSSPNPLKRAIAGGAYSAALDTVASTTNAVSGLSRGIF